MQKICTHEQVQKTITGGTLLPAGYKENFIEWHRRQRKPYGKPIAVEQKQIFGALQFGGDQLL